MGKEISELFFTVTNLENALTNPIKTRVRGRMMDGLKDYITVDSYLTIDASEGFGKNRQFQMSFSQVTSRGFRVSWLRYADSHKYEISEYFFEYLHFTVTFIQNLKPITIAFILKISSPLIRISVHSKIIYMITMHRFGKNCLRL